MSDTTKNDDVRWKYLASVVTTLLVVTLAVLLIGAAVGALSLSAISQAWFILFASTLSASVVWLFGPEAYNAVKGKQ